MDGTHRGSWALLLGCLFGSTVVPGGTARLYAQHSSPSLNEVKAARVRGAELRYLDLGHGDPVIFVHGSLGDLETFEPQFEAFKARYRVLAYSRRFHPPNPPPPGATIYSGSTHAADLGALITELHLASPRIVSLSYGAYTALLLALEHPERIRALVLAEPPLLPLLRTVPGGDSLVETWQRQVLRPSREAFERDEDDIGLRLFVGGLRGAAFFDGLPAERQDQLRRYTHALKLQMLTPMELYFPALTCEDLRRVTTPVLLVGGDRSPAMFAPILQKLAKCLPHAERVVIPRAGHNMQIDNPAAFNDEVLEFLQKH